MGMGQVTLGFRSLAVKLAVFFIMAMLLAWALGGTLWPRPHIADLIDDQVTIGNQSLHWRLSLDERRSDGDRVRWQFMRTPSIGAVTEPIDSRTWRDRAGPIGSTAGVYFGGRDETGAWVIVRVDSQMKLTDHAMPDRLAVEQQLGRLKAGLPLQSPAEISALRPLVLEPATGLPHEP